MWLLNPRGALPLRHFATLEAFLYLDVSCMFADVTRTFLGHEYALYLEKPHLGWMQSLNYIKLSCVQCVQLSSFRRVLLLDKKPQGTTLTWFTCAHVGRIPNWLKHGCQWACLTWRESLDLFSPKLWENMDGRGNRLWWSVALTFPHDPSLLSGCPSLQRSCNAHDIRESKLWLTRSWLKQKRCLFCVYIYTFLHFSLCGLHWYT
jgi:hypothetical protein